MKHKIGDRRIGICKYTGETVEQIYDGESIDSTDEKGWVCIHKSWEK